MEFDPTIITEKRLNEIAQTNRCSNAGNGDYKQDKTPKYYMSKTKYASIPMLEVQKCRVNAALGEGLDAAQYLSPRQLEKV